MACIWETRSSVKYQATIHYEFAVTIRPRPYETMFIKIFMEAYLTTITIVIIRPTIWMFLAFAGLVVRKSSQAFQKSIVTYLVGILHLLHEVLWISYFHISLIFIPYCPQGFP
ncbi:MAG: hypothetical protein PUB73_06120 [Bacteroidales bacterium]|nr:hypothetical protein [Bacteroidales bacterium]